MKQAPCRLCQFLFIFVLPNKIFNKHQHRLMTARKNMIRHTLFSHKQPESYQIVRGKEANVLIFPN